MKINNKTTFDALNVKLHIFDITSGKISIDKKSKQKKLIDSIPPAIRSRCLSFVSKNVNNNVMSFNLYGMCICSVCLHRFVELLFF